MSDKKPVIVAIDDEVEFTSILNEYFSLRGYDISVANKGIKGLELIKEKKPDILILDLKMPGISGEEVLALSKKVQAKAKIIFITAYDDGGPTRARLLKLGAFACLDKPIPSLKILEEEVFKAYKSV